MRDKIADDDLRLEPLSKILQRIHAKAQKYPGRRAKSKPRQQALPGQVDLVEKRSKPRKALLDIEYRHRLACALAEARKLLKAGRNKTALSLMFGAGFQVAWGYQENRRRKMYEAMKSLDLSRTPQIQAARKTVPGFDRTPSDELVIHTADAVRAWKAARSRGDNIKAEAERGRDAWLPEARKQFTALQGENPTWGRQRIAKIVGKQVNVSYKTVLRHL
jgi:hypothetical protein